VVVRFTVNGVEPKTRILTPGIQERQDKESRTYSVLGVTEVACMDVSEISG